MRHRADFLALVGGFVMLVDTVAGGIAALGLDLSRMGDRVLAISLVLGFPIYLLDLWMDKRIAISMLGLFVFRWIVTSFAGPTPVLGSPWRGNLLLIVALVLLQFSKLRQEWKAGHTAHRA